MAQLMPLPLIVSSVKARLVLPFWYRLTQVVRDKGPLNACARFEQRQRLTHKAVTLHINSRQYNKSRVQHPTPADVTLPAFAADSPAGCAAMDWYLLAAEPTVVPEKGPLNARARFGRRQRLTHKAVTLHINSRQYKKSCVQHPTQKQQLLLVAIMHGGVFVIIDSIICRC